MKETFEMLQQSTKLAEDYAKLRHIVEYITSTLGLSGEVWTQLLVDIDKGEKEALATRDNIRQNIYEERQSNVIPLDNKSAAKKILGSEYHEMERLEKLRMRKLNDKRSLRFLTDDDDYIEDMCDKCEGCDVENNLCTGPGSDEIHPEKMKIVKFGILQRDPEITVDLPDMGIIRGAGYVGKFYEPDEVPDVKDGTHKYKVYRIDKQAGEMELHYSVILKVGEVIEDHVNLIDVRPDYFSRAELKGYLVTNLQIDDMKVLKFMN